MDIYYFYYKKINCTNYFDEMNVRISSHQPQEFLVVVVHFAIAIQLPFLPE